MSNYKTIDLGVSGGHMMTFVGYEIFKRFLSIDDLSCMIIGLLTLSLVEMVK